MRKPDIRRCFGLGVTAAIALSITLLSASPSQAYEWKVDADATNGNNNGSDWPNAFLDLQSALAAAFPDDKILVAQGTYKPGTSTEDSFVLVSDVEIYGGYAGYGMPDPDERDVTGFETVLSGDLSGNDQQWFVHYSDNSYHVVDGRYATGARLDGFTITGGNARLYDGESELTHWEHGGGVTDDGVFYVNCTFKLNQALDNGRGGAISSYSVGGVMVYNCTFLFNRAKYGGAIYAGGSTNVQRIVNCVFNYNRAGTGGGGVHAEGDTGFDQSTSMTTS